MTSRGDGRTYTYTYNVQPRMDGRATVSLTSARSAAGGWATTVPANAVFNVDTVRPRVQLSYSKPWHSVNAGPLLITATFNERMWTRPVSSGVLLGPVLTIDRATKGLNVTRGSMAPSTVTSVWTYAWPVAVADGRTILDGGTCLTVTDAFDLAGNACWPLNDPTIIVSTADQAPRLDVAYVNVMMATLTPYESQTQELPMSNGGASELRITSMTSSDPRLVLSPAGPFSIAPGTSVNARLTFTATASTGPVTATVTIASNDPRAPTQQVPFQTTVQRGTQPTACPGRNFAVQLGARGTLKTIALDGSRSSAPDGETLSYMWAIVSSTSDGAGLSAESSPQASLTVAFAGLVELELTVTASPSGLAHSRRVTVTIQDAVDRPPTASAGADQTVVVHQPAIAPNRSPRAVARVALTTSIDARGAFVDRLTLQGGQALPQLTLVADGPSPFDSSDPETPATLLAFEWTQVMEDGPSSVPRATLANRLASRTALTLPSGAPGRYLFRVKARDDGRRSARSAPDPAGAMESLPSNQVAVTVLPFLAGNRPPELSAVRAEWTTNWEDTSRMTTASLDLNHVEIQGTEEEPVLPLIRLVVEASDDGLPATPGRLSYQWQQVSNEPAQSQVSLDPANQARSLFMVVSPGIYCFEVTVSDGSLTVRKQLRVAVDDRRAGAPGTAPEPLRATSGGAHSSLSLLVPAVQPSFSS
jgi:hypothetical protein